MATSLVDRPTADTHATLSNAELQTIDAYWRAANYLSVGQIYLVDNPLLREPLAGPHQAEAARPLGYDPRTQPGLRAFGPVICA